MQKAMARILTAPEVALDLSVKVSLERDHAQLEAILRSAIRRLTIRIHKPNPDDFSLLGPEVEQRLEELNAQDIETTIQAVRGGAIRPDPKLWALAELALSHAPDRKAPVEASVENDHGKLVPMTTVDRPLLATRDLAEDEETSDGVRHYGAEVINLVVRRRPRTTPATTNSSDEQTELGTEKAK